MDGMRALHPWHGSRGRAGWVMVHQNYRGARMFPCGCLWIARRTWAVHTPLHLHVRIRERWAATRSRVYDASLHDAPCIVGNQFARRRMQENDDDDAVLFLSRKKKKYASVALFCASLGVVYMHCGKISLRAKDGNKL